MSDFDFAHRTNWSLQNNPLSQALEELQSKGIKLLDLTESNPTCCGFKYPDSLMDSLSSSSNLTYSPLAKGILEAREAIAQYYSKRNLNVDPENLVLTSSTSEGYSFLLKLLTNSGDHVLIPRPSYPLFQFLLELHDVEFDYYPLQYGRVWQIDTKAFEALITPQTRCVIVVNPNNPTGSYISPDDRLFLNQMCQKYKMSIISDEVFLDYPLLESPDGESLANNKEVPTFVLSGISKILGLPQMKLSWVAVNGPPIFIQAALEKLEIISDTYLSVNTPVQNALATWLLQSGDIQQQILKRIRENLNVLKQQGLDICSVEGGWYAVIKAPSIQEEDMVLKILKEDHVVIHPGYFFDFQEEGYLVVSLLPDSQVFNQAVERITRRLKK